jgi:transposase
MDILMMKDDILSEEVILNTPWAMLSYVQKQNATIQFLLRRIEILEAKIKENSTNSNRPPSSDSPFQKKPKKKLVAKKRGPKVGHQGYRQQLMSPTQKL